MPLIYVQRYVVSALTFLEGGTQYVDGTLTFPGPTTIVLSNDVFFETGNYVLFEYGSFNPADLVNVTVDSSALSRSDTPVLTDDPENNRILLSLKSKSTNGCQYINGPLDIAGPLTVVLNSALYVTPGQYILFDAESITAGSLSNITIQAPPGRSYIPGSLVKVSGGLGQQIKFTLA